MNQIRFRLQLRPRPGWGSSQRSPRPSGWIQVVLLFREGEREEREKGKEMGRKTTEEGGKGDISPPPWLKPRSANVSEV